MKKAIAFLMVLLLTVPCAAGADDAYGSYRDASASALEGLAEALWTEQQQLYVYKDFADTENHFTQKAKMNQWGSCTFQDMDENWKENPHTGFTCIRCDQTLVANDWGGWLFLNGMLAEDGQTAILNDGQNNQQGLNLSGAQQVRFYARGEKGGETVEFLTCGFGEGDPSIPYRDSTGKKSKTVTLTTDWQEYVIDLGSSDMSYIALGFGCAMKGADGVGNKVFYLDDVRFTGKPRVAEGGYYLLRSYVTYNQYIFNAAFTYDNAVAAMAFISAGRQEEARTILDSLAFAVENDRYKSGRIRNAYVAGNISSFTGWAEEKKARIPGWYDVEKAGWFEDQYQAGSNVGNTSYAALAFLQYDRVYGSDRYVQDAAALMDWVLSDCRLHDGPGFTAGYDGWPEAGPDRTYYWTYKSIEHNIDAYAAFLRLYEKTGDIKYQKAAESAYEFICSMYDNEKQCFYTGTLEDGVTVSDGNIVLDAQVWCCMALGDRFAPYMDSLRTVSEMKTDGGYPFCRENANGGWWAEGTAYTALMYRLLGQDNEAAAALDALVSIQLDNGWFPAATVDNLSTGFYLFTGAPWEYGTSPHISPTAWFIMAVNGFNPYAFD